MNRLGYYIREGWDSIYKNRIHSVATIFIIFACLVVMGSFSLVALNVNHIIRTLEGQVSVLAFVDETCSEEAARALEGQVLAIDNVSNAVFVTRQEAMDSYLGDLKYSWLFEEVEADTFRDRYLVYLTDIGIMADTQNRLADIPGIAEVTAHLGVARGMLAVQEAVNIVSAVMVVLLLVISIFMMTNTLRMTAFSRRTEVAIVRMIGATNSFIRSPFTVEGIVMGTFGSALAFLAEWALYTGLTLRVDSTLLAAMHVLPFSVVGLPLLLCDLAFGLVVGVFGSHLAIRSYMRV